MKERRPNSDVLDRATIERVARMYRYRKDAARALGCSPHSLSRALQREGIVPRWGKP